MMILDFHDPANLKTKKIVFEDVYNVQDSKTLEYLKELSSKRLVIENSINRTSSITEAIAREFHGGLTSQHEQDLLKLEQYLPMLENLTRKVDLIGDNDKMSKMTSDLHIRWTSPLSWSPLFSITGSRYFQIDNLQFELGMSFFYYAAVLRERALEILPEDLVHSTTLFRKAAGVYHYLAHEVLPPLNLALTAESPPESKPFAFSVMSLICLAEAQAVTIRRAEEKGTTCALLAKLHFGVTQFLDEATNVLYSATDGNKNISTHFLDFIAYNKSIHDLKSHKYLAEEFKSLDQIGVGIGILQQALNRVKNNVPSEMTWQMVFKSEIESVEDVLRKYEHENDFICYQKIPEIYDLPSPQGKKIVNFLHYEPQKLEKELLFKI